MNFAALLIDLIANRLRSIGAAALTKQLAMHTTQATIADTLSAIDCECHAVEAALSDIETLYFDRGQRARIARSAGCVHVGEGPILLRLLIEDGIEMAEDDDPRELLIAHLESMVAKLKNGGR